MKTLHLLLVLISMSAINGHGADCYSDRTISATVRLSEVRDALHKELNEPTETHRGGGGGLITLEYQLAQLVRELHRIVNYYDEAENRWRKKDPAFAELCKMMNTETNTRAREVMMIALACCGDTSHQSELIEIVQRKDTPTLRGVTIEALGNNGCRAAIPALVNQLNDPYEASSGCIPTNGEGNEFPIRDYSARALRRLGIPVEYVSHGQYKIDADSLKRAVKAEEAEPAPAPLRSPAADLRR